LLRVLPDVMTMITSFSLKVTLFFMLCVVLFFVVFIFD
jgi:hypothetical protein